MAVRHGASPSLDGFQLHDAYADAGLVMTSPTHADPVKHLGCRAWRRPA